MAANFVVGDPYIKWVAQAPFVYVPRFGDVVIKWIVQAPEVSGLGQLWQ